MARYIIIRGPLGCGKSTISKAVSKRLGARLFPVDRVLDENGLADDWEDGYISQEAFRKANSIIAGEAKRRLENGETVIFDGNFYWESQIDDLVRRLDYPHNIFTLTAPLEVCIGRDMGRENPHGKEAAKAVYKKSASFSRGIRIDVTKELDACVEEILSYIGEQKQL